LKLVGAIKEVLSNGELMSMSELRRRLKKKGISVHMLVLSGYLHALADLGAIHLYRIGPVVVVSLNEMNNEKVDSSNLINRRK